MTQEQFERANEIHEELKYFWENTKIITNLNIGFVQYVEGDPRVRRIKGQELNMLLSKHADLIKQEYNQRIEELKKEIESL